MSITSTLARDGRCDTDELVATLNDSLTAQLFKLTGAFSLLPDTREAVLRDVARNLAQAVLGVIEPANEEAYVDDGFWRSCSGCHESNEGHPTGPYSARFRCNLGGGCRECGGLGAIWEQVDEEALREAFESEAANA